jgi:predicted RNA-binding protein YlxR (DUF448 family)
VLVRLALGPDGVIAPDIRARAPGRGAWIGVDRANLEAAMAKGKLKGALARAFKTNVTFTDDLAQRLETALERAALDRLGLEAKASNILMGSDKIEGAARKGQVRMLLHANDAGDDGTRKLDSAWGQRGLVLPVDRSIISIALGRANAVHIAITNKGAANRIGAALGRWTYFIGQPSEDWPCGIDLQGSSERGASVDEYIEGFGLSE